MALATASTPTEVAGEPPLASRRSLAARILAVNLIAIVALAGGILYLDSFRGRQIDTRRAGLRIAVAVMADALASGPDRPPEIVERFGRDTGARLLLFAPSGEVAQDSWRAHGPNFALVDPASEPLRRRLALKIDRVIDAITGVRPIPRLGDMNAGQLARWPEAVRVLRSGGVTDALRRAPDGTYVLSAAARVPGLGVLLIIGNPRDITFAVRNERWDSFLVFMGVLTFSVLLSSYLARTIVLPLRRLARATRLVRAGRERGVVVPRLPERADEIGQLARAVSDMAAALRTRIDATEAFAAEVAHELKNPLASLRSALETFGRVKEAKQQRALLAVMTDDVVRLDRLIGDISEASRLEAEISRARFAPVDLGALAREVVGAAARGRGVMARAEGAGVVLGDAGRLRQVAQNLVDNAVSFSPAGGSVRIAVERIGARVALSVEDQGPGVPSELAGRIFERFYTQRPEGEAFGRHSGLGLAIARAIVEAHGGTIAVENRAEGGAHFTVWLAAA